MSLSTPNLKPKSTYVHGVGADTTVTLETQPCVSPRTQKFKAWRWRPAWSLLTTHCLATWGKVTCCACVLDAVRASRAGPPSDAVLAHLLQVPGGGTDSQEVFSKAVPPQSCVSLSSAQEPDVRYPQQPCKWGRRSVL